ncbi:alpha/beta fold hydrolase [Ramlibacter terrae]|uniref:Alpha/beta fold hydrolase n=1 Tax=Ramlibacter terrae TaxID=2732511 RepID=A0ABX6P635_9BURK|nr:alpha/beta fold hydrolase [Ramlibacter terrae]
MKPVLLLVTGMLNDASVWEDVAAELRPSADVRIATPVQESISAMAGAAWTLVDGVPADVPLVVAGFSLGGYVAIEMLSAPRRPLRAAALVSTSARPESPEGAATREKTIAAMGRDFPRVVDGVVQFGTDAPTPELAARLRTMMLGVGAETAIRQHRAIMARADHRAALAALDLPVTVLVGHADRITPPELSREIAALVPGAQLEVIAGAGHMLPAEQPHAVATALRRVLA